MEALYLLIGIVVITITAFYLVYQFIASLLIGLNSRPLSTDQKEVCKQTLAKGKKPSPYCKIYIQKGRCGSKSCDVIH